jgi:transposase
MYPQELTDTQWSLIRDLMPAHRRRRGRPWNDHRLTLDAIFYILESGAPWRLLPHEYPPWPSVYDRFDRWRRDGTLDRILERLQVRLDRSGRIRWDLWCVDGTSVRASRSAAGAGKRGIRRSRRTTPLAAPGAATAPRSI